MESFTAMSPEGVQAVKAQQRRQQMPGTGYKITTAGEWTEDHQTLRSALLDYQDAGNADEACMAEDLVDELYATNGLNLVGEAFDLLVDALVHRWEHGDEKAGGLLSGIAQTLGIEFI